MNGIADMGGMHGFGPVVPTNDYVPFHADWERRTLGIQFSTLCDGFYHTDDIRRTTESIRPDQYLRMSYFERWLHTTEVLLIEKNIITREELAAGRAAGGAVRRPTVSPEVAMEILRIGASTRVQEGKAARFAAGDAVLAKNINPDHHTRLPRYVRGKCGFIVRDNGIFTLPDSNSQGLGGDPQHVYLVRFSAMELWGEGASPRDCVQIELFDSYLEQA